MKKSKKNHNMSEETKSVKETANQVSDETPLKEELNTEINQQATEGTQTEPESEAVCSREENESKLAEAEARIGDMQDKYLRQLAEFDNYRKRTVKEKAELIKNGSADIITAILPIIDDLERAITNSRKSDDFATLKDGIELIYNKLMHTLEQKGLQKISPKDEPFNTDYHEAIAMIPASDESAKGKVLDCTRDGYILNDKVLRHAQVAVAQ